MSNHDELKMQQCTGVCFLFYKLFVNFPACSNEVENSEIYKVTGTKRVDGGCFSFL
jgi:hypothetical protein